MTLPDGSPAKRSPAEATKSPPSQTLGRDESCEIVISGDGVSRRHARISRVGGRLIVEDLDSANGTWINEQRIDGPTPLCAGDVLGIGSVRLELKPDGRLKRREAVPTLTIESRQLAFDATNRRLLEGISLSLFSTDFTGLMGPSGAGKTTLMNLINGYLPPSQGQVLINGRDLYSEYFNCSGLLGYVPQDDIMHRDLTVRQALRFTGRLRLPPDTTAGEIEERITQVVGRLQIESTLDVRIGSPERKGISGGQRKRVNLAMELLTDPSVLFLDEPTSGLSSEDTLTVMKLLRGLADSGKCILLTLHQPSLEAFRLMTHLIVVSRDVQSSSPGRLVYFGPCYPDSIFFFNPQLDSTGAPMSDATPDAVLRGLARQPTDTWQAKYSKSQHHIRFVAGRAGRTPTQPDWNAAKAKNRDPLHQCLTLIHRNLLIKWADGWNTLVLLGQAPIIAMLIVLVFGQRATRPMTADNWAETGGAVATSVFLICLSSIWFGCSNAIREIVGEWAIYHRERMVNLQTSAYVFSKVIVGGLLCAIQCAILLLVVRWGCNLQGPLFTSFIVLMASALSGIGIGLIISSLARTQEIAMGLLPLVLIPMVIFGGSLLPVHNMQKLIRPAAFVMPTRHGFEALMLLEAKRKPLGPSPYSNTIVMDASVDDPDRNDIAEYYLPRNRRLGVPLSIGALVGQFAVAIVAILLILRFRDVH
jgi:ABC-type multidrug transport system ATPase subunit